jgi:hypothetical protein
MAVTCCKILGRNLFAVTEEKQAQNIPVSISGILTDTRTWNLLSIKIGLVITRILLWYRLRFNRYTVISCSST